MAYYTLLEVVQRVLESMDSDEVNSISDTTESDTVANIVKENFLFITGQSDSPVEKTLFELEASGDSTKPILMTKPSNIWDIEWIKYNVRDTNDDHDIFELIEQKSLPEFLDIIHGYDTSDTNVSSFTYTFTNADTVSFHYYTDGAPTIYTVIEGDKVFFNSHDSVVDTTLQKTKSLAYGSEQHVFTKSDSFEIPLDQRQIVWLINECKDQAAVELKQFTNTNARAKARKGKISSHRHAERNKALSHLDRIPRYGKTT